MSRPAPAPGLSRLRRARLRRHTPHRSAEPARAGAHRRAAAHRGRGAGRIPRAPPTRLGRGAGRGPARAPGAGPPRGGRAPGQGLPRSCLMDALGGSRCAEQSRLLALAGERLHVEVDAAGRVRHRPRLSARTASQGGPAGTWRVQAVRKLGAGLAGRRGREGAGSSERAMSDDRHAHDTHGRPPRTWGFDHGQARRDPVVAGKEAWSPAPEGGGPLRRVGGRPVWARAVARGSP